MNCTRVPVSGFPTPDRSSTVSSPARNRRLSLGRPASCSVVFAIVASALVCAVATPPVYAEYPVESPWHPDGGGKVEVSGSPLKIRSGETAEYCLKLSDSPPADADANDPWFVFINAHIDGEVYVGRRMIKRTGSKSSGFRRCTGPSIPATGIRARTCA